MKEFNSYLSRHRIIRALMVAFEHGYGAGMGAPILDKKEEIISLIADELMANKCEHPKEKVRHHGVIFKCECGIHVEPNSFKAIE